MSDDMFAAQMVADGEPFQFRDTKYPLLSRKGCEPDVHSWIESRKDGHRGRKIAPIDPIRLDQVAGKRL